MGTVTWNGRVRLEAAKESEVLKNRLRETREGANAGNGHSLSIAQCRAGLTAVRCPWSDATPSGQRDSGDTIH